MRWNKVLSFLGFTSWSEVLNFGGFTKWDNITIFGIGRGQEDFLHDMFKRERKLFMLSDYDNRPYSDLILFIITSYEICIRTFAAFLVDLYVLSRDASKSDSSLLVKLGFKILYLVTGVLNAFVAQPLLLVANCILHMRAVIDNVLQISAGILFLAVYAIGKIMCISSSDSVYPPTNVVDGALKLGLTLKSACQLVLGAIFDVITFIPKVCYSLFKPTLQSDIKTNSSRSSGDADNTLTPKNTVPSNPLLMNITMPDLELPPSTDRASRAGPLSHTSSTDRASPAGPLSHPSNTDRASLAGPLNHPSNMAESFIVPLGRSIFNRSRVDYNSPPKESSTVFVFMQQARVSNKL